MKKHLTLILACLMLLTLLPACGGSGDAPSESVTPPEESPSPESSAPTAVPPSVSNGRVVRIGVFEPLTGDLSAGGRQELLGIRYANLETPDLEIGGKSYTVELVCADNRSSVSGAEDAAKELTGLDVSLVLGSYGSEPSIAGVPVFEEAGLAVLGASCTAPLVTAGNDCCFRLCFQDTLQGAVLAGFARDSLEAEKAFLLGESGSEYSQGLMCFFEQAFDGQVVTDSFLPGTSDFSVYLKRAKDEGCGVIFCPVSTVCAALIVKQAAEICPDIPILGSDTWESGQLPKAASGSGLRLYAASFCREEDAAEFYKGFRSWLLSDPEALADNGGDTEVSSVSVMGCEAYYTALEAIKAADSVKAEAVRDALSKLDFAGLTGQIKFNDAGDVRRDTVYLLRADTEKNSWVFEAALTPGTAK